MLCDTLDELLETTILDIGPSSIRARVLVEIASELHGDGRVSQGKRSVSASLKRGKWSVEKGHVDVDNIYRCMVRRREELGVSKACSGDDSAKIHARISSNSRFGPKLMSSLSGFDTAMTNCAMRCGDEVREGGRDSTACKVRADFER